MNAENTKGLWGDRLDSTRIYFDNVRVIPTWNQVGKFCAVCHGQPTYVELSLLDRHIAYCCDDHVLEARRGRGR